MLDEMAIMEMLFNDLTVGYLSTEDDEDEDDLDDFEDHLVFEAEFFGLSDDFDDFGYDYGWD
jgi:E3 ubiquitin-protein ligase makorin